MAAIARREYGTGSVYQRKDGLWVGTIEAGYTKTGARRRVTVSAQTEAEAKRKLRDKRLQVERDGLTDASARATVKSWAEQWQQITVAKLRPKSYATSASAIKQWIVPTIGHKRLDQLTPGDIRAVAAAQRKAGRSSTTARNTHRTLLAMLKAAMVEGHAVPARVLLVKAPEPAVNDRTAMTIPEALAVLAVASTLPHGSRWAVALLHGMRQAECLGLTWDAIDLDADVLNVEWQLQSLPYLDRAEKWKGFRIPDGFEARHLVDSFHLTRPKSRKGFRVIPLVPAMLVALEQWRGIAPANPWGLVWPTAAGRPANVKHDLAEWHALQGTACVGHPGGRYYHVHEARHVTATNLQELGADEHTVTSLLGHSSIVVSRGYMHTDTAAALVAMQRFAERLQLGGPGDGDGDR